MERLTSAYLSPELLDVPFGAPFRTALSGFCEVDILALNVRAMPDSLCVLADRISAVIDAESNRRVAMQFM